MFEMRIIFKRKRKHFMFAQSYINIVEYKHTEIHTTTQTHICSVIVVVVYIMLR